MRNISRGKKLNVLREKILKVIIWFRTLEKSYPQIAYEAISKRNGST